MAKINLNFASWGCFGILLLMMGTEIFKIDASWADKLTKTRVQFLLTPSVDTISNEDNFSLSDQDKT